MVTCDVLSKVNDLGTKLVPKHNRLIRGQLEPAPYFAGGLYERLGVLNRV